MKSFKISVITDLFYLFSKLVIILEYTSAFFLQIFAGLLGSCKIWKKQLRINLLIACGLRLIERESQLCLFIVILFNNLFERALK